MKDFIFNNTTKVYFGKGYMNTLPTEVLKYGKKVLLVYGGGSIKRNGLYDLIIDLLNKNNIEVFELPGVEPNPRHTTVNKGAQMCKDNNIDLVLAVGGGSTIDCAKGIAALAVRSEIDVWEVITKHLPVTSALPIIAVLTNAATGSEMDEFAVISNLSTNEKNPLGGFVLLPKVAYENPEYSYTLPSYQTACGAFDIFNHVLDNYYLAGDATFDMILEMQEAVMKSVVKWTPIALKEPENYEARANLMWASSMALNGVLNAGTVHSCTCHALEHELSAYYDITHGHGLAILAPRWLTYILDESNCDAIYRLGVKVFDVEEGLDKMEGAKLAINELSNFCFKTLGLQPTLTDLGIDDKHFYDMANHAKNLFGIDKPKKLSIDDIVEIYKMCL